MESINVPVVSGPVDASVEVPGSKSITNRALVCAALGTGVSVIEGCAPGDDTNAMLDGLGTLGIEVTIQGDAAVVSGTAGTLAPGPRRLTTGLAGTTSRFLTAVCALGDGPYVIDGDPPLRRRPMGPLHDALRQIGAQVTALGDHGALPVEISGVAGGGRVSVRGDVSSQYLTALMLIGPLLAEGLEIEITSPLVSRPYVELTATVMRSFGVTGVTAGDRHVTVEPGGYTASRYAVEPDASSASYPLAVAALVGGRVTVPGLGDGALQGDARFADLLAAMGCEVVRDAASVTVTRRVGQPLQGIDVDMADVSDLVPTLAVVATAAESPTRITGVGFVRNKESDRLGDLATELRKTGADVTVEPDGLSVRPTGQPLTGARLATHHDHRLAMAFGVLGSLVAGVSVDHPEVVSKSWPGFWDVLTTLTGRRP